MNLPKLTFQILLLLSFISLCRANSDNPPRVYFGFQMNPIITSVLGYNKSQFDLNTLYNKLSNKSEVWATPHESNYSKSIGIILGYRLNPKLYINSGFNITARYRNFSKKDIFAEIPFYLVWSFWKKDRISMNVLSGISIDFFPSINNIHTTKSIVPAYKGGFCIENDLGKAGRIRFGFQLHLPLLRTLAATTFYSVSSGNSYVSQELISPTKFSNWYGQIVIAYIIPRLIKGKNKESN